MEKIIIIAKYADSGEANIAKTKLEAVGIDCFLSNSNLAYSAQFGYIQLKVKEDDKARALEILDLESIPNDENIANDDDSTAACPFCNSTNTSYGVNRNKANVFYVVSIFFLQSLPFYKKRTYFCNACQKHFKIEK